MVLRILFLTSILSIAIGCGLPDVTGIPLDMNQPFILKIEPGDKKVTLHFESQNNEPAFSGYNIYFGDNLNPRMYKIYSPQRSLPSIHAGKNQSMQTYSFTIESGLFYSTNNSDIFTLDDIDIPNGLPLYVWVSAYQISPVNESTYSYDGHVKTATPRPEILNSTFSSGTSISIEGRNIANLQNNGGVLYFHNVANGSIQMQIGSSLATINTPPTTGYTTTPLQVLANRIYPIKIVSGADSYYAKIFVRSVSATSAVIDYCLQTSPNILSY